MFDWYTDIFADKASVSMRCLKSTKAIKTSMQKKKNETVHIEEKRTSENDIPLAVKQIRKN